MGQSTGKPKVLIRRRDKEGRLHCDERDPKTGLTLPALVERRLNKDGMPVVVSKWYTHGKHLRNDRDPVTGLSLPTIEASNGSLRWTDEEEKTHREEKDEQGLTLPAIIRYDVTTGVTNKGWFIHGVCVRKDVDRETGLSLPCWEGSDGFYRWSNDKGEFHRVEIDPVTGLSLPAFILPDGKKYWFIEGKSKRIEKHLHTVETPTYRAWMNEKGYYHRESEMSHALPAIEYEDGRREYYIDGVLLNRSFEYEPSVKHSLTLNRDTTCPICYETLSGDCHITKCLHIYHKSCLEMITSKNCPICRKSLHNAPVP